MEQDKEYTLKQVEMLCRHYDIHHIRFLPETGSRWAAILTANNKNRFGATGNTFDEAFERALTLVKQHGR